MDADAPPLPDAFPAAGSDADRLRFLVHYAVFAPSDRNTQPWRFHVEGDALDLRADRARALPVGDPHGRTLTISCGAALYHLRLAARHFGHAADVERLPDPADPDLLAVIRLGARVPPVPAEELLFRAIPERHTNRRAFQDRFVPPYLLDALAAAAGEEGAWLAVVTAPEAKAALADLVAEGDRVQQADAALRAERAAWVRPEADPRHDGLTGYALGAPPPLDFAAPLVAAVMRRFDLGERQAARDHERAEEAGALAVLGTDADAPRAWLRAGEALAHVLLRATAAGLAASFLNAPVEIPALRPRVAEAAGRGGAPQLLLRLGFGPALHPAPRRPADDVLDG